MPPVADKAKGGCHAKMLQPAAARHKTVAAPGESAYFDGNASRYSKALMF
jgi:hypothetical protein